MDDLLEKPTAKPQTIQQQPAQGHEDGALDVEQGEENETDAKLDWAKVLPPAVHRPVIPKRGEKEFEPRAQVSVIDDIHLSTSAGTALQQRVLHNAREAMFEVLRATRTVSSKNISYGIWYPNISRTHVTVARGIHFSTMGHSAPRVATSQNAGEDGDERNTSRGDGKSKIQKRLELLPEETIYLVERGSMLCWKHVSPTFDTTTIESTVFGDCIAGSPMSVQQVYTEMIGREGLTLEKFQVYAYLKRLGYTVARAEPPDPYYPTPTPFVLMQPQPPPSLLRRIVLLFSGFASALLAQFVTRSNTFDWWHPVKISRWLYHDKNYQSLFKSLRFIPSNHRTPLYESQVIKSRMNDTSYKIFYNVHKPSTPFKKTAPGKPDFQVVVVNARTTLMPSLYELSSLFDKAPEVPTMLPRRKGVISGQEKNPRKGSGPTPITAPATARRGTSMHGRLLSLIQRLWSPFYRAPLNEVKLQRPNPFSSLKMGKKVIVIAAVDSGNISFFKFGQGVFEEWPML